MDVLNLITYGKRIILEWGVERNESQQGRGLFGEGTRRSGQEVDLKGEINPVSLRASPQFRLLSASIFSHQHRIIRDLL